MSQFDFKDDYIPFIPKETHFSATAVEVGYTVVQIDEYEDNGTYYLSINGRGVNDDQNNNMLLDFNFERPNTEDKTALRFIAELKEAIKENRVYLEREGLIGITPKVREVFDRYEFTNNYRGHVRIREAQDFAELRRKENAELREQRALCSNYGIF